MHSQGRLDPCPGLLPAPCMSLDSSSEPSLMSVKAPCVQKAPILPGAEHPPSQLRHFRGGRAQHLPKGIYYAVKAGTVWGAYVYVGSLFLRARRGEIFMTDQPRTAYGDQRGVHWNRFLANKTHESCRGRCALPSFYAKLSPRAFCDHFASSWASNLKYLCHHADGPRHVFESPSFENWVCNKSCSSTRQGPLRSPAMGALRSPAAGFGARPFLRKASAARWAPSLASLRASERQKASEQSWRKKLLTCVRVGSTWADEVYVAYGAWFKKAHFSFAAWWIYIIFSFAGDYQYPLLHPHPDLLRVSTPAASVLVPWKIFSSYFHGARYFWEKKDLAVARGEGWATASMCDFPKITNTASCLSFPRQLACLGWHLRLSSSTARSKWTVYKGFWGRQA